MPNDKPRTITPEGDDVDEIVEESSLSAIEEADRSHQIATARKYPRSLTQFTKELTEIACLSQPTAMAMIYSLPRAGKQLVGPSVRFAEAVIACWGNARVGVEVVDVDRQNGVVTSEGRYYDCEKNVGIALRKRRRIVAKKVDGHYTADAIQITGDAGSSIALRDAILRGVPKAIWEPIWLKAKETAAGDAKSLAEYRDAFVKMFGAMGITEIMLLNALGVSGPADIGADQVLAMKAWKEQLNSRESTIEDIFGSAEDEEIEAIMVQLKWPNAKKNMARESFKGRRSELLEHVRAELQKTGGTSAPSTKKASAPTETTAAAATSEDDTKSSKDTPEDASATTAKTTDAVMTTSTNGHKGKPSTSGW